MSKTEINVNRIARLSDVDEEDVEVESSVETIRSATAGKVVELNDGSAYLLQKEDPKYSLWIRVLESKTLSGDHVYVEADAETRAVKAIFPTYLRPVNSIQESEKDDGYDVTMLPTPSPRHLNRNHPRFEKLFAQLEQALHHKTKVIVTISPKTEEIIDVREAGEQPSPPEIFNGPLADTLRPASETLKHDLSLAAVPFAEAVELFGFLASQSSIPFEYLNDCCASRAHVMCDLLRQRGVQSGKIWNYGSLFDEGVATLTGFHEDHPANQVDWVYHVAPVISVLQQSSGPRLMVLDPSMFNRPTSTERWRARLNERDEDATREFSDRRPFFLFPNGVIEPDDNLVKSQAELENHSQHLEIKRFN